MSKWIIKILFLVCILAFNAQAQLTWRGFYISAARTTPYNKWKTFNKSDINIEGTAIIGLNKKWSVHAEIIYPIGQKPLLRFAIATRIF